MTAAKYRLAVVNPGHFHAALSLRERHPRLDDEVFVYGEAGADLEAFLAIVATFNARAERPTAWRLKTYRGEDYLDRLIAERPAEIAVLAGRNGPKMAAIGRLHRAGFHILGDKPLLIAADALPLLEATLDAPPLVMEIMTGRHEPANRLLRTLAADAALFGSFPVTADRPALTFASTHHLYKIVNGAPLLRPSWFFEPGIAGEGITDVTTHLVDLAQRLIGGDTALEIELVSARQWPTEVPREIFSRITGLDDFPEALRSRVEGDVLRYLGNAALGFRLEGVRVEIESLWALAIPEGGGDTHRFTLRGSKATLVNEQSAATGFENRVTVSPVDGGPEFEDALRRALAAQQDDFPGLEAVPVEDGYRLAIPDAMMTTHEEHFAEVLDRFLGHLDNGAMPASNGPDLMTKYRLLMDARALSRAAD